MKAYTAWQISQGGRTRPRVIITFVTLIYMHNKHTDISDITIARRPTMPLLTTTAFH